MLYLGGRIFRCECGCNVFTKLDDREGLSKTETRFKCNGCRVVYIGEYEVVDDEKNNR